MTPTPRVLISSRAAFVTGGLVGLILLGLAACTTSNVPRVVTPQPTLTLAPPTPVPPSATRQATPTPAPAPPTATRHAVPSETPTLAPSPTASATATRSATPIPPEATATPTASPTDTPPAAPPGAPAGPATPAVLPTPTLPITADQTPATPLPGAALYVFPVQPPTVTQYGAYHHDYPATDIFCPIGSRFVAPTAGVLDFVRRQDRWDPQTDDPAERGGLAVALIGDDGVRYYGAHLSQVAAGLAAGQRVQAGQLLGLTGNTGDARPTPPHLHFGISPPTRPDDWAVRRGQIAPYPYLRAWAADKPLRPQLTP